MSKKSSEMSSRSFALLLSLPVIIFLAGVMIYPLLYAAWLSFQEISFFGGFHADYVGFDNFRNALMSSEFWWSMWVTTRFTVISVILSVLIGLGLAMVMHRVRYGQTLLRTIIILPWSVSLYATGVMWSYLARGQTGFFTSLFSILNPAKAGENVQEYSLISHHWIVELLAIGNAWNLAPLIAFFLLANLKTIPTRLYDLAELDRLGAWGKFIHVTLPPLRYTLFVFTSIATILSMKMLDFIYVMTSGGPGNASSTMTFLLYDMAFRQSNMGYSAAMSFYLLIFIIAATLLLYFFWGRKEVEQS